MMLQVGKSEKGREAVQSHTGRVAGTREMFAAMARETGIIQTESFVEFFGTAKALAMRPARPGDLPRNRRAAVVSVSGGAASLCADQLSEVAGNCPHSAGDGRCDRQGDHPARRAQSRRYCRRVEEQCAHGRAIPPLR